MSQYGMKLLLYVTLFAQLCGLVVLSVPGPYGPAGYIVFYIALGAGIVAVSLGLQAIPKMRRLDRRYRKSLTESYRGRHCHVSLSEGNWRLDFADGNFVVTQGPWRIISRNGIALTSEDDGQRFGCQHPVCGVASANHLLHGQKATYCDIDIRTGDMEIGFSTELRLQFLGLSSGYEGWNAYWTTKSESWIAAALGSGEVAIFLSSGHSIGPPPSVGP